MRCFLLSSLIVLLGCSSTETTETDHFWLSFDVREKLQKTSKELLLQRPPLEFSNGNTVLNCEQYFQQNGGLVETSANYAARSHYLICDALQLVQTWPVRATAKQFDEDLSLCSDLNLVSFKHSLRPRIQEDTRSLAELFDGSVINDQSSCSFQGEGRNFVLDGVLLIRESQKPQRLWVWVTDEVLDATYRSYLPVWFVFDESQNMWVADQ